MIRTFADRSRRRDRVPRYGRGAASRDAKEKSPDMPMNILLLDDSKVARMQARRVIADALPDAALADTDNLTRFFELVEEIAFDLVLIDYNMPEENGLSVAARLQARHPHLPMALLTANIQEAVIQRAHAMGLQFLAKPLRRDAILAALAARSPAP
jgi:CheY-like chemotaxis protein